MLKPYIRQLKSQDPAERRQAIKGLARLRNEAVIPLLETVAQSDPDPELRALAEKAIRYVKANVQPEPKARSASSESLLNIPPSEEGLPKPRHRVSTRDRDAARKYVNAAFSYYQAGDRARAVEWLGKGLSLNPNLQSDSFVAGIVQGVMQMDVDEALPILTHPDRRKEYVARLGGKQPTRATHVPENATWDNVLIDFGLYGLVTLIGQFAVLYFAIDIYRELWRRSPELYNTAGAETFFNLNVREMFFVSLLGGVYATIGVAVQGAFIHLAATFLLGGKGTLAYLYRKLVPLQMVFMLVVAAAMVFLSLLIDPVTAMTLLNLVNFVSGFVLLYLLVRVVAEVYDFGVASGCGAIFLGGVIFIAVFFCGIYGLVMLLAGLLGGA